MRVAGRGVPPRTAWAFRCARCETRSRPGPRLTANSQNAFRRACITLRSTGSWPWAAAAFAAIWSHRERIMNYRLLDALHLKYRPMAILLSDVKPVPAQQFKEGCMGCVAAMLLAAARGRTVVFDRKTFGCPGGGVGLGFGNAYAGFPIDRLLSTGGQALGNGQTWDMVHHRQAARSGNRRCRNTCSRLAARESGSALRAGYTDRIPARFRGQRHRSLGSGLPVDPVCLCRGRQRAATRRHRVLRYHPAASGRSGHLQEQSVRQGERQEVEDAEIGRTGIRPRADARRPDPPVRRRRP